ncbi:MAG: serine/threonine-protein kinase [Verrucomicrobiota bacterium]
MSETNEDIVLCFACGNPMSVMGLPPYSRVACPTCGEENRIKKQFGPYTVTKRHAIGGMSSVFAGIDTTLNREVALKILSEEYSKDEKRIAAFEDEARLTASFSHPHVVKILTTGRAFGLFYIAMEFVPGGHLEHRIYERGKLTETEVLPLAIQIAEGLKGAQSAGLIHRDIKPGNILFDAEGNAKIVDFGLALVTKGGEAKADEIWATPYYVPPEAIEGGVEDFRSDIYAFGATLYHTLSGVPSCTEDTMDTKLLRVAKTKVIPLKRVAPEVSYETCAIVDRAMSYDPRNRFRSYDEMIIALQAAIKALETGGNHQQSAAQAHALHRMQVRAKQKKTVMITVISVVVTILVVFLVLQFINSNAPVEPSTIATTGHTGADGADTNKEIISQYRSAKDLMKQGKLRESEDTFIKLFLNSKVEEPTRSWAGLDGVAAALLDGRMSDASRHSKAVGEHIDSRSSKLPAGFAAVIAPTLKSLQQPQFIDIKKTNFNKADDEHLMACMISGLKNWEQGGLDQAVPFFEKIVKEVNTNDNGPLAWYRKVADHYLSDLKLLKSDAMNSTPSTPNQCKNAIEELERTLNLMKTRGRARFNIRSRQSELRQHEKYLEKLLSGK